MTSKQSLQTELSRHWLYQYPQTSDGNTVTVLSESEQLRVLRHANTHFVERLLRGSYLRNNCSYPHEAKAVVEAFNRAFFECHAEKFDFSPTESLLAMLDVYI